jgi:hypothetical protein
MTGLEPGKDATRVKQLIKDWKAWRDRPFPSQVPASSELGFELRSIDTFAAGCLDVPEDASDSFVELATLCRHVLGAVDASDSRRTV